MSLDYFALAVTMYDLHTGLFDTRTSARKLIQLEGIGGILASKKVFKFFQKIETLSKYLRVVLL